MSKVWMVTGSARGLGREIVEAALEAGERVIATARDLTQLDRVVAHYGDRVRALSLDVTDSAAALDAVRTVVNEFGRLDVVVNNAGFGHIAPFEQAPMDDFRAQMETNFYGVVNVTRAVLPVMRAQKSGDIIQISSVGGRVGTPGLAAYQSAKWAVGGFVEVLAMECAPLNVRVTALEPGGMRTGWCDEALRQVSQWLPEYEASVGKVARLLRQFGGHEASDPAKVAQVIVKLAHHDGPLPAHLLLGSDALHFASFADDIRAEQQARWADVTRSTDYAAGTPIPPLPDMPRPPDPFAQFDEDGSSTQS